MEKVTLQPGVWTRVYATLFIQSRSNQSGIRIHYGDSAPAPDTDLYFVTQEFDLKPFRVPDSIAAVSIYLMPDEDMPVDVVVF